MSGSVDWKGWPTTISHLIKTSPSVYSAKRSPNPRKSALYLLNQTEAGGEDLSARLDAYLSTCALDRRDQSLITELVYGVSRQQGKLDWQIDQFSKVKKIKTPTRAILRLALYQLLFLDRIPDYAVVNTSVNFAKEADGAPAGRFVNGLLRNLIRSKNTLPSPSRENLVSYIALTTSHPEWMVRRWLARFGEEKTLVLCASNNEIPPMTLRVNVLKTSREKLIEELRAAEISAEPSPLSPSGVFVKGVSVASLPSFQRGDFYIQDEGAQLTAYLVDPRPGERILDFCAAPGGKTSHLAELAGGKANITATDVNADRLSLLKKNLNRLETPGVVVEETEAALGPDRLYDKILVDAPCSSLGVLRRIPEGKWFKKETIITSYAGVQLELLEKVLPYLQSGGTLVYATCSTESEENEAVVEVFSKKHPEISIEAPSSRLPAAARHYVNAQSYFTTAFNLDKMDGFFAVCWRKGF